VSAYGQDRVTQAAWDAQRAERKKQAKKDMAAAERKAAKDLEKSRGAAKVAEINRTDYLPEGANEPLTDPEVEETAPETKPEDKTEA
jgi:hypothetical protein